MLEPLPETEAYREFLRQKHELEQNTNRLVNELYRQCEAGIEIAWNAYMKEQKNVHAK